jgi:hypothetical protein
LVLFIQRSLASATRRDSCSPRSWRRRERLYDAEFSITLASAQVAVGEALLLSNDRGCAADVEPCPRHSCPAPQAGQHLTRPLQQLSAAPADR